ncbi:UNVERIFIED_CONTAM: hypothetical protein FKN15_070260 [Acipenser sinensis]
MTSYHSIKEELPSGGLKEELLSQPTVRRRLPPSQPQSPPLGNSGACGSEPLTCAPRYPTLVSGPPIAGPESQVAASVGMVVHPDSCFTPPGEPDFTALSPRLSPLPAAAATRSQACAPVALSMLVRVPCCHVSVPFEMVAEATATHPLTPQTEEEPAEEYRMDWWCHSKGEAKVSYRHNVDVTV